MSDKFIAVATGYFASTGAPLACQIFVDRGDGLYVTALGFDNSPIDPNKAIKIARQMNESQPNPFSAACGYPSPTRYAALDKNGIKNK